MSIVTQTSPGDNAEPSPSIWGSCPNTLLNDKGFGYFFHEDFLGAPTGILAATLDANMISFGGNLKIDCDTDTVLTQKAAEQGGYLDIETDGDDNDAAAIFSQPLGPITRNSGKELLFEARVELGAVADQGVFVGIAEEAALSRDVLADNIASNGVITESLTGFLVDNGDTNAFDIVLRKDAGTLVNILNDSTNSAAITAARNRSTSIQAEQLVSGPNAIASLVADTEVKVGIRFDGLEHIHYYVNGVEVAKYEVDSTVDQSKNYAAIVAVKTGTGAAVSIALDWVRAAVRVR